MRASTPQEAEEKIEDMTRRLDDRGRSEIKYAIPGRIFIEKSDEKARMRVEKLVGDDVDLHKNIKARGFVGSPQTIAGRIQKLSDLGFDYIIFQISPASKTLRAIEEYQIPMLQEQI